MNENDFTPGAIHIAVCSMGANCAAATKKLGYELGADAIYQSIKDARNGLGLRGKVLVQKTSCQGWCDYAPVCTLWPSGKVYRGLKPAEAEKFIHDAVIEDKGSFSDRKIWDFSKDAAENHEERKLHGVVNPAKDKNGI